VYPNRCRICPIVLAIAIAALAVGCGDDEEDGGGQASQPRTVNIELSGSGKKLSYMVPKSVPGGVLRIRFTNRVKGEHDAQLGYVDRGHTAQEGLKVASAWAEEGRPLPDWVHLAGGAPPTAQGESRSVIQELPAAEYFVIDTGSEQQVAAFFEVAAGEGEATVPSAPGRIEATEYKFEASGLKAGTSQLLIDNVGAEPHFVEGVLLKPGKTIEDARRYVRTEKGEPPFQEKGTFTTPVIDGGVRQVVEVEAQKGDYALLCFVPDRKGGPPHAVKGMISPATIN
jgi:hypothetical protein